MVSENPDFANYIMKFMENGLKVNNLFSCAAGELEILKLTISLKLWSFSYKC